MSAVLSFSPSSSRLRPSFLIAMAAPIPATNNTLVLALPPGMTGEQYLSLQGQLGGSRPLLCALELISMFIAVTISICVAAAFAIVLWN
jgi:hypothetical protein